MSSRLNNNVGNIFQGKDNLLKSIASYTRAYNTYQQCTAADGGNALAMTYTPYYGKKVTDNVIGLATYYVNSDLTTASNNGTSIATTEDDCQDICNVNKTCYGFTYDTSNNICRLQGSGITTTGVTSDPTINSYIKKYTQMDCGTMTVSSASFSTDGGLLKSGSRSLQDLAGNGPTNSAASASATATAFTLYSGYNVNTGFFDIRNDTRQSEALCKSACLAQSDCGGYVYVLSNNKCYQKNMSMKYGANNNGDIMNANANSGIRNIGAGLNLYNASNIGASYTGAAFSGSIAQSAKALYTNIQALNNMPFSNQSVIDASYNTMLNQRSNIDLELQNLYNVPNSIPNMYAENWDLTIYMGIIWTILATSLIYYIFTKL
jgi:hypothetical protein